MSEEIKDQDKKTDDKQDNLDVNDIIQKTISQKISDLFGGAFTKKDEKDEVKSPDVKTDGLDDETKQLLAEFKLEKAKKEAVSHFSELTKDNEYKLPEYEFTSKEEAEKLSNFVKNFVELNGLVKKDDIKDDKPGGQNKSSQKSKDLEKEIAKAQAEGDINKVLQLLSNK